jgi:LysM repeat protein
MRSLLFLCLLHCALPLHARPQSGHYTEAALDEFRIEIDDLKHALKSTQVELNLLDERINKQNHLFAAYSTKDTSSSSIQALEKKVLALEKTLDKIAADLRTLSQSTNQVLNKMQTLEHDLLAHEKRFEEVSKLKGTLTTISKAISQKPSTEAGPKTYRVKSGDSLGKIAQAHHTSIENLRKLNRLSDDKILPGQELRLTDDTP